VPDPLSRERQAALARHLSVIRQQLQDDYDLCSSRYGKNSNLAEIAAKPVACTRGVGARTSESDGNNATMARRSEEALNTSA
jgi:hypothetical protein